MTKHDWPDDLVKFLRDGTHVTTMKLWLYETTMLMEFLAERFPGFHDLAHGRAQIVPISERDHASEQPDDIAAEAVSTRVAPSVVSLESGQPEWREGPPPREPVGALWETVDTDGDRNIMSWYEEDEYLMCHGNAYGFDWEPSDIIYHAPARPGPEGV